MRTLKKITRSGGAFGHDLLRTARALRHSSVTTTIRYLSFDEEEVDQVIVGS